MAACPQTNSLCAETCWLRSRPLTSGAQTSLSRPREAKLSNIVMNIAKGRVVELYNRVKANDPANSALIIVPIETSGLEADSVLVDKDDLAAFLTGATNEQTTM